MTKLERRMAMIAAASQLNVYVGCRPGGGWFAGTGDIERDGPSAMAALVGVVDAAIAEAVAKVAELQQAERWSAALRELKAGGPDG